VVAAAVVAESVAMVVESAVVGSAVVGSAVVGSAAELLLLTTPPGPKVMAEVVDEAATETGSGTLEVAENEAEEEVWETTTDVTPLAGDVPENSDPEKGLLEDESVLPSLEVRSDSMDRLVEERLSGVVEADREAWLVIVELVNTALLICLGK
jgi:hypothetical protein